jgi:hypothetical protein
LCATGLWLLAILAAAPGAEMAGKHAAFPNQVTTTFA